MPESVWNIFESLTDWTNAFRANVRDRLLLFPTDGFLLQQDQFAALAIAAKQCGDEALAVAVNIEGRTREQITEDVGTQIELTDYRLYASRRDRGEFLTECCLLSTKGLWGIWLTGECFALAGGSAKFVEQLQVNIRGYSDQPVRFAKAWIEASKRTNASIQWLRPLLVHLYGEAEAGRIVTQLS